MNAILYGVEEATLGASGRGPDKWTLVLNFGGELLLEIELSDKQWRGLMSMTHTIKKAHAKTRAKKFLESNQPAAPKEQP